MLMKISVLHPRKWKKKAKWIYWSKQEDKAKILFCKIYQAHNDRTSLDSSTARTPSGGGNGCALPPASVCESFVGDRHGASGTGAKSGYCGDAEAADGGDAAAAGGDSHEALGACDGTCNSANCTIGNKTNGLTTTSDEPDDIFLLIIFSGRTTPQRKSLPSLRGGRWS